MKYKTIHENEVFINPPKKEEIKISEKLNMEGIQEFIDDFKSAEKEKLKGVIEWEKQIEEDIIHIHLKNLISSTPNDQELGEKVREMFR